MHKIVLIIKDHSKVNFVLELLSYFDFIEIHQYKKTSKDYDLFASVGSWKGRDIDSNQLRVKAWNGANR